MRFSIGKLMVLVALCGLNFFLLSMIDGPANRYGVNQWFGELILLGGLPMLDLLVLVALATRRGHRGSEAFLVAGAISLGIYLGLAAFMPRGIRDATIGVVNLLLPLVRASWNIGLGRVALAVLLNLGPQLALAAILAPPIRRCSDRKRSQKVPAPEAMA